MAAPRAGTSEALDANGNGHSAPDNVEAVRDIARLERGLNSVATEVGEVRIEVTAITTAIFGHPLAPGSEKGLIGEVQGIRQDISDSHGRLERLYLAILALAGAGMSAAVTVALALH